MKKKLLAIAAMLLVCVLFAGMASAEHGYARVSDIPMAVDFTCSLEIAEDGTPYVQTDYPFEETGAMQMVLIYINHKEGLAYISYDPATKQASFFHVEVGPRSMDTEQKIQKAAQMIRDGKMELWFIDIGTVHGGPDTDWWLAYHVPQKYYWSYEERTFSPSFYDEKNPDGKLSIIYYGLDGVMTRSYIRKISPSPNYAELYLNYDAYGKLTDRTSIMPVFPDFRPVLYDPETGLFGGKKIDELDGPKFTEADLQVPAPAALDPGE